jgi:formate hydrogenlyase subunit 3/multisubunit Na+/H+ antiporter MnhD subunit
MATIYALIQNDAKKLLAYSSVAQLGYIIVGLSTGTKLGVMAALFLAVVHAIFKGALFMVAGAVERQAGTTDMTKVSGLIRKMPYTFLTALISIIALAGVPPLGGFVGKWMLYESLITESDSYFLVIVVFFSSTAAFLYSYRFLFGLFLGQEEKETEHVKEAPLTMLIPMLILALLLVVTGLYPGILFEPIAHAMQHIGFSDVNWDMSVLTNIWGEQTNMSYIFTVIGSVFVLVILFLTLKGYKSTKNVGTKDISTSGEIPLEEENLTYQMDFFKPFERAAAPLYKRSMDKIWNDIGNALEAIFNFTRRIYTGNGQTYALFVIIFLVILLFFKDTFFAN